MGNIQQEDLVMRPLAEQIGRVLLAYGEAERELQGSADEYANRLQRVREDLDYVLRRAEALCMHITKDKRARQQAENKQSEDMFSAEHIQERVYDALTSYRCQFSRDADDAGLTLLDILTPAEETAAGSAERELLAEHIIMTIIDEMWANDS